MKGQVQQLEDPHLKGRCSLSMRFVGKATIFDWIGIWAIECLVAMSSFCIFPDLELNVRC